MKGDRHDTFDIVFAVVDGFTKKDIEGEFKEFFEYYGAAPIF